MEGTGQYNGLNLSGSGGIPDAVVGSVTNSEVKAVDGKMNEFTRRTLAAASISSASPRTLPPAHQVQVPIHRPQPVFSHQKQWSLPTVLDKPANINGEVFDPTPRGMSGHLEVKRKEIPETEDVLVDELLNDQDISLILDITFDNGKVDISSSNYGNILTFKNKGVKFTFSVKDLCKKFTWTAFKFGRYFIGLNQEKNHVIVCRAWD